MLFMHPCTPEAPFEDLYGLCRDDVRNGEGIGAALVADLLDHSELVLSLALL